MMYYYLPAVKLFNYIKIIFIFISLCAVSCGNGFDTSSIPEQNSPFDYVGVDHGLDLIMKNERFDLNQMSSDGHPLTVKALLAGNIPLVHALLNEGADPNLVDIDGAILLSWAAMDGRFSVAKNLMDTDTTNINHIDVYGFTPLMWASKHGHTEVVKLLLDNGADKYYESKNGFTALRLAKENNEKLVVELLTE